MEKLPRLVTLHKAVAQSGWMCLPMMTAVVVAKHVCSQREGLDAAFALSWVVVHSESPRKNNHISG